MSSLIFCENSGAEIQIKYETVGVNLHTVENKISLNSIYECLTILMSWLLFVQFLIMKCLGLLLLYCSTSSLTFFVNFGAEIQIKCETVGVNLRTVKKANFS
jgi:cytochrome b561